MWAYVRLNGDASPISEIISYCTDKNNLRLGVYDLKNNCILFACVPKNVANVLELGASVLDICTDAHGMFAILAYDFGNNTVYLIDSTNVTEGIAPLLLCISSDILNGYVDYGVEAPMVESQHSSRRVLMRDAKGRFVKMPKHCLIASNV